MKPLSNILLIRTDRIGDVVLTTPAASVLKANLPNVRLTFLAREYTKPLLTSYRHIDEIICYDPEKSHKGIKGHWQLAKLLRKKHFDAAIFFYPRPALAAATWLAGIPLRVGYGYRWYSLLFNKRLYEHRKKGNKHELDHNLSLLKSLNLKIPEKIDFEFFHSPEMLFWRDNYLKKLGIGQKFAIIHPGSGGSAPNLSLHQYRLICQWLLENTEHFILFTGSKEESKKIEEIIKPFSEPGRFFNIAGDLNLKELMAIIAASGLLIATSTGPLHIANAYDIPVLSFYCPAPPCAPKRWGPYHQMEWAIAPEVTPCQHGKINKCIYGNCLEKVTDEMILAQLEQRFIKLRPE